MSSWQHSVLSSKYGWVALLVSLFSGLLLAGLLGTACRTFYGKGEAHLASRVERGKYLVTTLGCNNCHTPFRMGPEGPEPDLERMLSGHPEDTKIETTPPPDFPWGWYGAATNTAFAGPWGVSFAANLTPEDNTGLGIWSEEIFIQALRNGRHWGQSRPILPPMPWFNFAALTDEDLKSMYAYLRTIPAVVNRVPEPLPPYGVEPDSAASSMKTP